MYNGYNERFFSNEGNSARSSAKVIFPYILEKIKPKTIIDFGCGTGEWLKIAKQYEYVEKVVGLDGDYAAKTNVLDAEEFFPYDLNTEIDLHIKFDMAMSLEVAEHIRESSAHTFIGNLARHADIVLFSAALPHQGGKYHINEQYPSYWEAIFRSYGFVMCDCLRKIFWNIKDIDVWYKQNIMFFCKETLGDEIQNKFASNDKIINMIHPDYWEYYRKLQYIFPFSRIEKGEKIIIYGAGEIGRTYISQVNATKYAQIVCWCDGAYEVYRNEGLEVYSPNKVKEVEFDKIVVAVKDKSTFNEIAQTLCKGGIGQQKLIWENPIIQN